MSQFGQPAYEIERPTGQCAMTGQPLQPGEPYMATLVEVDESAEPEQPTAGGLGLKRMDISWEAWQSGHRPAQLFCYWKTLLPEPNRKRRLFVDDDVLMNLFRRLADDERSQRIAFRFVLGLILMRKKCLRYDGTARRSVTRDAGEPEAQDWWQVTPKLDLSKGPLGRWNEGDRLEMLDPHLDDEQIELVAEQLSEVLEAEL